MKNLKIAQLKALYLAATFLTKYLEVIVLIVSYFVCESSFGHSIAAKAVLIGGLLIIPLFWLLFNYPQTRKKDLQRLRESYQKSLETLNSKNFSA